MHAIIEYLNNPNLVLDSHDIKKKKLKTMVLNKITAPFKLRFISY